MAVMDDARQLAPVSADFCLNFNDVRGSGGLMGGGSGKGGKGAQKNDAANTLRSNAKAQIVEVLGEGEIVGLVDGAKSIFFDTTPLQNPDGTFNFKGVTWQQRKGLPDQEMLKGVVGTQSAFQVGVEIKNRQEPPIRTIAERNATSVRIVVGIQSLVQQDQKSGSLLPADLDYVIERRANGGQWEQVQRELFLQQKTTSAYQKASVIDLPEGGHPYSIRVRKVSVDHDVEWYQANMAWESYTVIVAGKFIYPNTAMVALDVDASNFGSSVPTRFFDVKGLIIQVPSNYDPETRVYNGFWDGTFKRAWTNNPAWVFYDLITNNRYGLGEFIDASKVDKMGLYEVAQWCDGLVDDGKGGKEPRYTYNGVLNTREEAFKVLQQVAASWRGMAFWSVGQVFAVADMPADYTKILAPANVIGGAFKYSRTAKKTRNSVAMVSWNDPEDYYRPAIEVVQHDEALDRFGWRVTEISAVGCTSRGLAHRIGRWILDTEHTATESVEFEMALDALANDPIRPGHIIAIADPRKAQTRIGGRVADRNGNRVTLDKAFEPLPGSTYRLSVVLASGNLETRNIVAWEDGNETVVLEGDLSEPVVMGAMWAITGTDVAPRQYRVLSVTEPKKNTFKIAALFHDPQKYARVEEGIVLDPIRYTRPKTKIAPVTNLTVRETQVFRDGLPRTEVMVSWSPANDWLSNSYSVFLTGPDGDMDMGVTFAPSMTFNDLKSGGYTVYVTALGMGSARSEPATADFEVKGWDGAAGPEIANLRTRGGVNGEFSGRDCVLDWDVQWPEGIIPYDIDFVARVFDLESRELLSEWISPSQSFTYTFEENQADGGPRRKFWVQIRARDVLNRESAPASLTCSNPPPELIIPDVVPTTESVFVSYDRPADPDFQGGLVWMEREQGFDPLVTKPAYDGPNTLINLPAVKEVYYYVRFAAYDAFSKVGLNISPEQRVYVTNKIIDVDAPEIPTGLVLETEFEVGLGGVPSALIRGTWAASTAPNFKSFQVEIKRKQDQAWVRYAMTDPIWEVHGLQPGETYQVRVRALNGSEKESGWSEVVEIVAALNTQAPGPVTQFEATGSFRNAYLTWVDPIDPDLAYVEIWAADTAEGERTLFGRANARQQSLSDPTLAAKEERFYWARTVNSSGVFSEEFVGPVSAVSPIVQKEEIASQIVDQTSFAEGLTAIGLTKGLPPVEGYDGPLIVINELDGKLYQIKDGAWGLVVSEVKVEDIVGKITSDMLAEIDAAKLAGQLTSEQIAGLDANKLIGKIVDSQLESLGVTKLVGQLKASQLEAIESAKLIGQIVDSQIAAVGVGKLSGQIVNTQISDGAISTPKLRAGEINADRLLAASITATQIAARAITADKIVAGSITANEIATGTITATQIAAGTITAYNIAADTLTAREIKARSISADKLIANSITANEIAAASITGTLIQGRTIMGSHIVAGSLTAGELAAKTITAYNIAAGTITGAEILAGSVSADRLVANSITAGQIAAGAIKADAIAAGAISADKIGVGLTSGNLLFGSDFLANSTGFQANWFSDNVAAESNHRTDWAPPGTGSAMVHRSGTPSFGSVADYVLRRRTQGAWENSYPCVPNQRYEFTGYVSVHRCLAQVGLQFLNAAGAEVGIAWSNQQGDYQANGALNNWARVGTFGVAPATAVKMVPICRSQWNGGNEPYVFWTHLYLGKATVNQNEFTAYVPNSSTVIDGGIVATNSLHADRIIASSITADKIQAGTITGTLIAGQTITGDHVRANSIYADRIQIGGGQSLTTWLGGPNNTQINGGYVAANTIAANSLKIGARGLTILGLEFSADKATQTISWTAGTIAYIDDNGNQQHQSISAGAVGWGGWISVTWFKGRGYLDWSNDTNGGWNRDYSHPDAVPMAFYSGWTGLNVLKGGSTIDGTKINAGTITASQIAAGQIQTGHLAAGSITAEKIAAGNVTADKIGAGTLTAGTIYIGSDRFALESQGRRMRVFGVNGAEHVCLGDIGPWTGYGEGGDYGIIIRDAGNNHVLTAGRAGVNIEAAYIRNLRVSNAVIDNGAITNAKIGNLEVDNIKISGGSITNSAMAEAGGNGAGVNIRLRDGNGTFSIAASMRGNGNSSTYLNPGQNTGELQIWVAGDTFGRFQLTSYTVPISMFAGQVNQFYTPAFNFRHDWRPGQLINYYFEVFYVGDLPNSGVSIQILEHSK